MENFEYPTTSMNNTCAISSWISFLISADMVLWESQSRQHYHPHLCTTRREDKIEFRSASVRAEASSTRFPSQDAEISGQYARLGCFFQGRPQRCFFELSSTATAENKKVRDRQGALASTRDACATQGRYLAEPGLSIVARSIE